MNFPIPPPKRVYVCTTYSPHFVTYDEAERTELRSDPNIRELFEEKDRLDFLFENGASELYYSIRDSKNSKPRYITRAGDKLEEIIQMHPHILPTKDIVFYDLCGGPGAWSMLLLTKYGSSVMRGVGITLHGDKRKWLWYRQLRESTKWCAVDADGGDITTFTNIDTFQYGANLILADGATDHSNMCENMQELYCSQIVLCEVLVCIQTITNGGSFVLKILGMGTSFTKSIIFILRSMFRACHICKPPSSRNTNSEVYVVCIDFCSSPQFRNYYIHHIRRNLTVWRTMVNKIPSLYLPENMDRDKQFCVAYKRTLSTITQAQRRHLKTLMDDVFSAFRSPKTPSSDLPPLLPA